MMTKSQTVIDFGEGYFNVRFIPCQLVWQVDQFDRLRNGHRVNPLSSPTRRLRRRVGEERESGEKPAVLACQTPALARQAGKGPKERKHRPPEIP